MSPRFPMNDYYFFDCDRFRPASPHRVQRSAPTDRERNWIDIAARYRASATRAIRRQPNATPPALRILFARSSTRAIVWLYLHCVYVLIINIASFWFYIFMGVWFAVVAGNKKEEVAVEPALCEATPNEFVYIYIDTH